MAVCIRYRRLRKHLHFLSMKFGAGTDYAGLGVCFQAATNKSYSIFITKNPYVVIFIPGGKWRVTPAPSVSTTNANVVTVVKKAASLMFCK